MEHAKCDNLCSTGKLADTRTEECEETNLCHADSRIACIDVEVLNDVINLAFALSNLLTIHTTTLETKSKQQSGDVFNHSVTCRLALLYEWSVWSVMSGMSGLHMTDLDVQDVNSF